MAQSLPSGMKAISSFVVKGQQMEKADPTIAYYCYLWAVQVILQKELHTKGKEEMVYATQLMDKLEKWKADLPDQETINDDILGKIYIENFALKIFSNAEKAQNQRRCTRQTAETFLAAASFLELLKLFGEIDQDNSKKMIFSKYHANRIAKALKAGEDPNLPAPEEPEVSATESLENNSLHTQLPPPPIIEDEVDESFKLSPQMARTSVINESLHPSRRMSPADSERRPITDNQPSPVSPNTPPLSSSKMSINMDNHFPTPPASTSHFSYFPPPPPQSHTDISALNARNLNLPSIPDPSAPADSYYTSTSVHDPPPQTASIDAYHHEIPPAMHNSSLHTPAFAGPPLFMGVPQAVATPAANIIPPPVAPPPPPVVSGNRYIDPEDSEAIAKAQKHARFAISALNYDDIATAVKELNNALKTLYAD